MKRTTAFLALLVFAAWTWAAEGPEPTKPRDPSDAVMVGARPRSIHDHLDLKVVIQIRITHEPKGELTAGTETMAAVTDSADIARVVRLLQQIPAAGTVHKTFAPASERYRLVLQDTTKNTRTLYFIKGKLRAPIVTQGEFYDGDAGKLESELLKELKDLLKKDAQDKK